MISQKSVQEIMEVAKVEEVIKDYITLKRRGVNLIGLCPFHNEKTPSFTVSPSKNIYKCFGCGKGGDSVSFLMEHEQLTFPEALRHLAAKFGVEIDETVPSEEALAERQHLDSLYIVNQFARDYYQTQLLETDRGKSVGLSYFKKRGFREETIRKFGLGYAPDGKDTFIQEAVRQGYKLDFLKKVGLTTQYDRDFFRDRVMFTIHNLSGKVIGFGGRILQKDIKAPKYVNTPETEIYNKSKVLYGAFFAKQAIRKQDECILVEGYTDVISLHQSGIENVVASSGTSLTFDQIRLIKRYTPNVKIIYDGDPAGIKAALRGVDLLLEQDLNVKIVLLPDGADPDSHLQAVGATAFREFIDEKARDFIMFKADLLMAEAAGDPVKKTGVIRDIVNSIGKIPDPIKRSLYIKECARIVDVQEQLLVNEANKILSKQLSKKRADQASAAVRAEESEQLANSLQVPLSRENMQPKQPLGDEFQEKDIVRVLVLAGDKIFDSAESITVAQFILDNIADVLQDFDNPLYLKVMVESRDRLAGGQVVGPSFFLQHPDQLVVQLAIGMMSSPYEYSENWEKRFEITLQSQKMPEDNFVRDTTLALKRFRHRKIYKMRSSVGEKIREYQQKGDDEQLMVHLKVKQKLDQIFKELSAELNTVVPRM